VKELRRIPFHNERWQQRSHTLWTEKYQQLK
jgi:hypothetical protein